ncbi:MAG: Endo-1,4-beta-xylanase A precursor [Pelotomaculum sp. PtaB.Bin104]|nr:MAG: Endo-1,4-beta-xylanase A precursor [Pelotomaculum sp. PtaB.Bin104]
MKNRRFNIPRTILITFILTISLCFTASAATSVPLLSVGDISGSSGAVVQVPVILESTGEVTAAQFDLVFDQQLLTYQHISTGDLTSAFSVIANTVNNSLKVIIYSPTTDIIQAGSGSIAIIEFEVADSAPQGQSALLELSGVILSDSSGNAITSNSINGRFTVEGTQQSGGSGNNTGTADTAAPAWPSDSALTAGNVTEGSLTLHWTAATDNKGVTSYRIYQDAALLGNVSGSINTYTIVGLTAGTQYTFKIEAGDAKGNWSNDGPAVTVKTSDNQGTVNTGNPNTAVTKTFADIQGHWAQKDIELMAGRNIVKGMTDSTFSPDNNITRAEFAALLVRALAIDEAQPAQGQFNDVGPADWYYSSVEAAAAAGLVKGFDENQFVPKALITREQMAVMIIRAITYAGVNLDLAAGEPEQLLAGFSDKDKISSWSAAFLAQAVKAGLINGSTPTTIDPVANATRAQATVIIKRMMEKAGRV